MENLINETAKIFDDPIKWNSFIEMCKMEQGIKNKWNEELRIALQKYNASDTVNGWEFRKTSIGECVWFLDEFGQNSLSIWFEEGRNVSLWASHELFDKEKVKKLLLSDDYQSLMCFRRDEEFVGPYAIRERGNFKFNDANDEELSAEVLAWYAGNKTEDFVTQVMEKVDRIRKDERLTQLLQEINRELKEK